MRFEEMVRGQLLEVPYPWERPTDYPSDEQTCTNTAVAYLD